MALKTVGISGGFFLFSFPLCYCGMQSRIGNRFWKRLPGIIEFSFSNLWKFRHNRSIIRIEIASIPIGRLSFRCKSLGCKSLGCKSLGCKSLWCKSLWCKSLWWKTLWWKSLRHVWSPASYNPGFVFHAEIF